MNIKFLLPLLLVSAVAQASIIPDRKAMTACDHRFDNINRSQKLKLRAGPVYTVKTNVAGTYQYYFNASNRDKNYRFECRARRIGKVLEFALEPGKWVFEAPVNKDVASN